MGQFVGIFFLAVLANLTIFSSALKHPDACKDTPLKSPLYRLKKHILCGIDSDVRPGGKNATAINLVIVPTLSHFDERTSTLELHSLMYMDWYDERLKWDATLFENITEMPVRYWEVWTPEVTHDGAGSMDPERGTYDFVQCYVTSRRGQVSCVIETVSKIKCDTDFTYWPYDRQNCTLVLGSWTHDGEELTIREKSYDPVAIGIYSNSPEWTLNVARIAREEKQSMYFKDSKTLTIVIDFILDRSTRCFRGQAVSPAIIMMVITIVTTYLSPLSIERFAVACSSIVIHMLCIMDLNWTIPHNGETVPNILLFYCNSLVLATIALLLTFVLGKIETTKTNPPKWVTSWIVWILRNKFGQFFLLSIFEIGDPRPAADVEATADDTGALVNSDSNSKKLVWSYVSILFLRISYYVFILTYFIMFIVLILTAAIRSPPKTVELFL